jgi:hypothetical protein
LGSAEPTCTKELATATAIASDLRGNVRILDFIEITFYEWIENNIAATTPIER